VETLLTALSWDVVALLNLVPVFKAFRTRELWVGGFLLKKIRIQKIIRLDNLQYQEMTLKFFWYVIIANFMVEICGF
jgi:hypothetical protein